MREIKFRAWNKLLKCMLDVMEIDWCKSKVDRVWLGSERRCWGAGISATLKHIELMQYTGLKDRKGKEIYEGDICKYWMDSKWKKGQIEFHKGGFGIRVFLYGKEPMNHYFGFPNFIPTPHYGDSDIMNDQFEVIGNIYENPKLSES